jgi:hypothetical protein
MCALEEGSRSGVLKPGLIDELHLAIFSDCSAEESILHGLNCYDWDISAPNVPTNMLPTSC